MNLELPPELEPTRRLLEASLRLRPSETPPAVPVGLLDEINRRFISQRIIIEPKRRHLWFDRLRGVLASPGFGFAAAAVMVFGVLTPLMHRESATTGPDRFRGIPGEVSEPAMILLIDGPPGLANTLAQSGQFESGRLMSLGDLGASDAIAGAKVILDFETATIRSVSEQGETVHEGSLPANIADLTLAVAEALGHL